VPCHRVIGANGKLTGFTGGLERKATLLAHEARAAASFQRKDRLGDTGAEALFADLPISHSRNL
jgi:methylated-DNA-[protein]-cysteine S-methyltransferase